MSAQQLIPLVTGTGSGVGRAAAGGHQGAVVFPNLRLFVDPDDEPARAR